MGKERVSMQLKSLLDVILQSRSGDISVLNRVIYVGNVLPGKSTSDLEDYHKTLAAQSGFGVDDMRGILLHHSNDTVLHLLEGPAPAVNALVNTLRGDPNLSLEADSMR